MSGLVHLFPCSHPCFPRPLTTVVVNTTLTTTVVGSSLIGLIANGPDCPTRTPPPQVTAGVESETSNPDQHRSRNRKQSNQMKLGYHLGYWSSGPPADALEAVIQAEELGFDSVWTAEGYGSDAFTPLAW